MASQLHSMDMDPTKPDTSAPDPDHNVSLSTSISTPSMANVSSSKQSEDFVAPGPSNVTLNTSLDNMDTSGTTPNENQEYMGSNEDALLRLLFLNQNTDMNSSESEPSEDFVSSGHPKTPPAAPSISSDGDWALDDQEISKLCSVLCGKELEGIRFRYFATFSIPIWNTRLRGGGSTKDIIRHIECLVTLLDANDGNPTLSDFYKAGSCLQGWPKASTLDSHLDYANEIFWLCINLPASMMPRPDYLKKISNQLFGRPLGGYNSNFSVTIKQIKDANITIMPTSNPYDHFLFKNGVLNLLELHVHRASSLIGLGDNVIAQKVGIESLGREILASYHSLLSEDPTWEEAVKIGLLHSKSEVGSDIVFALIYLQNHEFPRPFLLARRERDLIREIERRKKWWRMLARDIRRQYNTQPFLFYGSILALIFGVCQIIQTVESLQALFGPQTPQCVCSGA